MFPDSVYNTFSKAYVLQGFVSYAISDWHISQWNSVHITNYCNRNQSTLFLRGNTIFHNEVIVNLSKYSIFFSPEVVMVWFVSICSGLQCPATVTLTPLLIIELYRSISTKKEKIHCSFAAVVVLFVVRSDKNIVWIERSSARSAFRNPV